MQGSPDAPTRDEIEVLVRRAQQGEATAFAALYEQFYDKMFRYVLFRTGHTMEAEDITEEVFLRMLESISSFKFRGHPFSSWMYRIAHNLIVDRYRKRDRQKTVPLDSAKAAADGSSEDMVDRMDLEMSVGQVYAAMGGLTELQREVISLRFAGGLSVLETAQAMRKKENAVKALQHAAIRKLRAVLVTEPEKQRAPHSATKGSLA